MKRQSEHLQRGLFDEEGPPVVLVAEKMVELVTLLEALLREIAAELATGGLGDDQDRV